MKEIEMPLVIRHGLTADIDYAGEPVVYVRGVEGGLQPVALRLNESELNVLWIALHHAQRVYKEQSRSRSNCCRERSDV